MCARACQNFKAFVSSTKAAKLPVKTWLVPGEPLFLLRQTTAADEAAESWEGSPATGSQVPPPTALDSPIKAVSSQPQVFYRMTSFITLLFTGNYVYLIYHFFQDFFFSPCYIWLLIFLTAQLLLAPKQRRNGTAAVVPVPPVPSA